jgi:hypothetical protein
LTVELQLTPQPEIETLKSLQPAKLDNLFRQVSEFYAAGRIDEDTAGQWYEAIELARRAAKEKTWRRRDFFRRRKSIKSRDRAASIERRRRRAAYAPVSPSVASSFTTGELAVLSVIADEVRKKGRMMLPIDMIASIAGVCRSLVQKTQKKAEDLGLIDVKRERESYDRSKLNVVRITCRNWLAWIWNRGGSKNVTTTNKQDISTKSATTAKPCIERDSHPHTQPWKHMISRTSPGQRNIPNPLERCSSDEAMNSHRDLADLIR